MINRRAGGDLVSRRAPGAAHPRRFRRESPPPLGLLYHESPRLRNRRSCIAPWEGPLPGFACRAPLVSSRISRWIKEGTSPLVLCLTGTGDDPLQVAKGPGWIALCEKKGIAVVSPGLESARLGRSLSLIL